MFKCIKSLRRPALILIRLRILLLYYESLKLKTVNTISILPMKRNSFFLSHLYEVVHVYHSKYMLISKTYIADITPPYSEQGICRLALSFFIQLYCLIGQKKIHKNKNTLSMANQLLN